MFVVNKLCHSESEKKQRIQIHRSNDANESSINPSIGQPTVEPKVDLRAFLKRQRLEDPPWIATVDDDNIPKPRGYASATRVLVA